jgi:hypothetical protein
MKKETNPEMDDELRPEYDLGKLLKDGVRGKYADRFREGTNLVLLDPEVARAFPNEEAVNEALRLVIQLTKIPVDKPE